MREQKKQLKKERFANLFHMKIGRHRLTKIVEHTLAIARHHSIARRVDCGRCAR